MTDQPTRGRLTRGQKIAGTGCIFGLAPLLLSFVFALIGSGVGNVLHWYTLFTAPVGVVIVIIGIAMWVNARGKHAKVAGEAVGPEKEVRAESQLSPDLTKSIRTKYLIGAGIAAVLAILETVISFPMTGSIGIGAMALIGGSVWVAVIANKLPTTRDFQQLRLASLVTTVSWIVLYGLSVVAFASSLVVTVGDPSAESGGDEIVLRLVPVSVITLAITSLSYSATIQRKVNP